MKTRLGALILMAASIAAFSWGCGNGPTAPPLQTQMPPAPTATPAAGAPKPDVTPSPCTIHKLCEGE